MAPHALETLSKLDGFTQPSIVRASDARIYAVKFKQFTGQFGLLSEVIGTELMARVGLPVPDWKPIYVSGDFIDDNRTLWLRKSEDSTGRSPVAGLHFGSRLMYSTDPHETYDFVPGRWIHRIRNRIDFVGALLVDLWTNNCDRRQCVFLRIDGTDDLRAVFIDHDQMLGGYIGDEKTCPRRAMVPDVRFYASTWTPENVSFWKSRIDRIDDQALDDMLSHVPVNWASPATVSVARAQLVRRRATLGSLILEADDFIRNGKPIHSDMLRHAI